MSDPERRGFPDRRRRATPILSRHWLFGRRRGGRRGDEARNLYIDRYSTGEWALVCGILLLSALDMVLTLQHIGRGGSEANPLMAWFLARGVDAFGVVKMATTVVGLFSLLLHVRFHRVRSLLTLALGLYVALMGWHAYVALSASA